MQLSDADLNKFLCSLKPHELSEVQTLLDALETRKHTDRCKKSLIAFCIHMMPTYKAGGHLKRLAGLLQDVEQGIKDRILVNMPPRFGKSQMISIMYPAWYLGHHPTHKIIIASHTADLAVDMLRKVRNVVQSDEYRQIFPGTQVMADAKAAGKWNTTDGGEAFAVGVGGALAGRGADLCVHPTTYVETKERGRVHAGSVVVGEHLRSHSGFTPVLKVIGSTHYVTTRIAGIEVSDTHPVWVFGRGWVPAIAVEAHNVLWMTSLCGKLGSLLRSFYAKNHPRPVVQPDLQHLGAHATAVHQSKRSQLFPLRSAGNFCVRALELVREFFSRYGPGALTKTHAGPYRRGGELRTGELPVGGHRDTAEQQTQLCLLRARWAEADGTTVGASGGYIDRHVQTSSERAWYEYCRSYDSAKNVACPEGGYPTVFGWARNSAARFLGRCSKAHTTGGPRARKESYFQRVVCAIAHSVGVLLGVRAAGEVVRETHTPRNFVNFMVGGDNTFIADTVLTHNCVVDDPFSEQDVINGNYEVFDKVYEWYAYGVRTRLMPGGRVAILHTRWSGRDLTARLLKDTATNPDADQFELFEFPAILEYPDTAAPDPATAPPILKSLWPEQWTLDSLLRTKASMPAFQWNAQYQQNPTGADAALIKREHIQWWTKDEPPECEFIVQAWDTALTTKTRSDYSVCQTWGVFYTGQDENKIPNAILLNSVRGKWEFPDLKVQARRQYDMWKPDSLIIETKASGQPLVDELRRGGLFVSEYSPGKGQDKMARVNSVTDMFASGQIWVPEGRRWAEEAVEEWVSFPGAEHDDATDCLVAGTMVEMADGTHKPIERITAGDMVRTPWGARPVGYATCTGKKELYEVSVGEHQLVMSGNHPIATQRGWVMAKDITPTDTIVTVSTTESSSWLFQQTQTSAPSPCISTDASTTDTRIPNDLLIAGISHLVEVAAFSTGIFGSSTTAQYPTATTSTTSMGTSTITTSATSKRYREQSIKLSTGKIWWRTVNAHRSWLIWPKPKSKPQSGIAAQKVESGTARMPKRPVLVYKLMCEKTAQLCAWFARSRLLLKAQTLFCAATTARTNAEAPRVRRLNEKAKTYNFSVPGPECYYANGVLVHNCMTLALIRVRKGGLLRLATDYDDNDDDNVRRYPTSSSDYY